MKLVYELDPLLCPTRGSTMKLKSFMQNTKAIERLCASLGFNTWRAPPELWYRGQGKERILLDDSQDFSQVH